MTSLWAQGRDREALKTGFLTMVLVLPVAAYVFVTFRPTAPALFAEAQTVLVNVRIPHHCRPDLWIDPVSGLQIAWMVLGLALAWRTRLFIVLAVPFVLSVFLTLLQVFTASDTLALLFPWRLSVVLVPVATALVLTRLSTLPWPPLGSWPMQAASLAVVVALAAGGVWVMQTRQGYRTSDEEGPLMEHVLRKLAPGDLYFVPVKVPDLAAATRGSLSSDFKPLPEKKVDDRIIPIDLQRFRLHTGAPILVDFKSIPYRDLDVLEWRDRLMFARSVTEQIEKGDVSAAVTRLREKGVTHLVWPAGQELTGAGVVVFGGPHYRVYRLSR
jgi:hypothetical protein